MKGLILSGGAGTRLRPITHTSAKQLVPVANKPILFYGIEDMAAAGITEIGIIVGATAPEIEAAVGDGSDFGVSITYITQEEPLGLAHCVLIAHEFLGDDDFVMYLGDNMLQQSLDGFIARWRAMHADSRQPSLDDPNRSKGALAAQILLTPVPDPQRFGVAELDDDGHVVQLVEKPEHPPSDLALVGVYLFSSAIHEAVAAIEPSERGELEITDAIQWLIDHDVPVHQDLLDGWWLDTGKKDPLLESNRRVLESIEPRIDGDVDENSTVDGRVVIEAGARLVNAEVRGPAIIGRGSTITSSYIGPFTAIAANCEVIDSEIDQSVIMEGARILSVPRLTDSLLGRDTEVVRSTRRPHATRVMLGDHSAVELA